MKHSYFFTPPTHFPLARSHSARRVSFKRLWLLGTLLLGLIGTAAAQEPALALAPADAEVAALLQRQLSDTTQLFAADFAPTARFYAAGGYLPVWTLTAGPTPAARAGVALLRTAPRYGLPATDYAAEKLRLTLDSLDQPGGASVARRARAEQQLTAALLRFTRYLREGRVTDTLLRCAPLAGAPAFDAVAYLQAARRDTAFAARILAAQPTSRSYVRLLWAWQRLLGTDSAAARRLALPVALSLERLRWEPAPDSLYLIVNIPDYLLQVVRGPRVIAEHRVVVGKAATPTPVLFSRITYFQVSPPWRVPHSIAVREMLPRLRRDPGYLDDRGFELRDAAGQRVNAYRVKWSKVTAEAFPYRIRQSPAADNALGNVVFRFDNPYAVYLHDTPAKSYFKARTRALSHGCVRVQEPLELARFLLTRDNEARSATRLRAVQTSLNRRRTDWFALEAPVLLLMRYLTCEADGPSLRQLPDIYHRDAALAQAWLLAGGAAAGPLLTVAGE